MPLVHDVHFVVRGDRHDADAGSDTRARASPRRLWTFFSDATEFGAHAITDALTDASSECAERDQLVRDTHVRSVEGPDNCWIRLQRQRLTGVVFSNLDATITRADGTLRVDSQWFQTYAGTYDGRDFTAAGDAALTGGGTTCDGATFQQLPGVSNLSGRFAENDQSFTANEVNSYRLTTGELVTYTWAWTGTRR